jgi:hypothetical protein
MGDQELPWASIYIAERTRSKMILPSDRKHALQFLLEAVLHTATVVLRRDYAVAAAAASSATWDACCSVQMRLRSP